MIYGTWHDIRILEITTLFVCVGYYMSSVVISMEIIDGIHNGLYIRVEYGNMGPKLVPGGHTGRRVTYIGDLGQQPAESPPI